MTLETDGGKGSVGKGAGLELVEFPS